MFSGLVQEVGIVESVAQTDAGRELRIRSGFADVEDGESIAISGVCLTVREHGEGWFSVAAGAQTVARTTIAEWAGGRKVNLERALRLSDRLGGHLVQGHVDGIGRITATDGGGDVLLLEVAAPDGIADLFAPLGSVAVDGVSLTINALPSHGVAQVAVIDYTRRHTTLGSLRSGDGVHVEADMLAKYLRQLAAPYLERLRGSEQP